MFLAPLALVPTADTTTGFESTFLQYGVLGAVALILGYFAWNTIKRERERADRLEEQLRNLNETVQTQTMRALNEAIVAVGDAKRAIEAIQRRREPK